MYVCIHVCVCVFVCVCVRGVHMWVGGSRAKGDQRRLENNGILSFLPPVQGRAAPVQGRVAPVHLCKEEPHLCKEEPHLAQCPGAQQHDERVHFPTHVLGATRTA